MQDFDEQPVGITKARGARAGSAVPFGYVGRFKLLQSNPNL